MLPPKHNIEFFTVGLYHSTPQVFFKKLTDHGIDTFCDIRYRRGVRGSQYSFANSLRLQHRLKELGIRYMHVRELAPGPVIRALQYAEDKAEKTGKRERICLAPVFIAAYRTRVLNGFEFDCFLQILEEKCSRRVALFCVEENPSACHRSLVSMKLSALGYTVKHL